jgi:hypothetical protein
MIRLALVSLLFLSGCFDSLLGSPCRAGLTLRDGQCVANSDGGTITPDSLTILTPDADPATDGGDAGPIVGDAGPLGDAPNTDAPNTDAPNTDAPVADAPPDAPTCPNTQTDPLNCGVCGHACASGICSAGVCEGDPRGHVVAIGHDFIASNAPMVRVLGNAAALGAHHDLAIARWSEPSAAVSSALSIALAQLGRPSHAVALPTTPSPNAFAGIDVIIFDPRNADGDIEEANGVAWSVAFSQFLVQGGVVIVLEGGGGSNHRFARGAMLFNTTTPVVVTGTHLQVVAPTDAVAQQVISPYYAAASTVAFPNLPAVVASPVNGAVVFHAARP